MSGCVRRLPSLHRAPDALAAGLPRERIARQGRRAAALHRVPRLGGAGRAPASGDSQGGVDTLAPPAPPCACGRARCCLPPRRTPQLGGSKGGPRARGSGGGAQCCGTLGGGTTKKCRINEHENRQGGTYTLERSLERVCACLFACSFPDGAAGWTGGLDPPHCSSRRNSVVGPRLAPALAAAPLLSLPVVRTPSATALENVAHQGGTREVKKNFALRVFLRPPPKPQLPDAHTAVLRGCVGFHHT